MRADIKPRTVNGKTYTYRTKGSFAIEHNGITYNLGEMIPGSAMKKAHLFVRKFVRRVAEAPNPQRDHGNGHRRRRVFLFRHGAVQEQQRLFLHPELKGNGGSNQPTTNSYTK